RRRLPHEEPGLLQPRALPRSRTLPGDLPEPPYDATPRDPFRQGVGRHRRAQRRQRETGAEAHRTRAGLRARAGHALRALPDSRPPPEPGRETPLPRRGPKQTGGGGGRDPAHRGARDRVRHLPDGGGGGPPLRRRRRGDRPPGPALDHPGREPHPLEGHDQGAHRLHGGPPGRGHGHPLRNDARAEVGRTPRSSLTTRDRFLTFPGLQSSKEARVLAEKMTRRELRSPDKFTRATSGWLARARENPRETAIAVGGLLLVLVIVGFLVDRGGIRVDPVAGGALSEALALVDRPVGEAEAAE